MPKIAVLFCLFCLSACTKIYRVEVTKIVSEDAIFEKIAGENEPNVVLVCAVDEQKRVRGILTGFVVGKNGYVLTAHHLYLNPNVKEIIVLVKTNNAIKKLKVEDATPLPQYDMVLLKVDHQFATEVKTKARELKSGELLFSMNYAQYLNVLKFSRETPLRRFYGRFNFYVHKKTASASLDATMQLSSLHATSGASGGPVFDRFGNVVGMFSLSMPIDRAFQVYDWSVPIEHYENYLKIFQK